MDVKVLITRTPFRFSLYGGGLDYPKWYRQHPSRILCAGLDYYCYQTIRCLPPFFSHKYRACYSRVETANEIDEISHPAVREAIKKYGEGASLEISHVGDLPSRSGIGSSSAFTVGLINSLQALQGKYMGKARLANAAISLEQNEMQEVVGCQDQCAAAMGGLVLIEADKESVRPRRFICAKEYSDYICNNLLFGFDGIERFSSLSSTRIVSSISEYKNNALMRELASLSEEGIGLFSNEEDIEKHAKITKLCRDIKVQLNGDVDNSRARELIDTTEQAGSLCTRVMGAGGGGFFACWAPPDRHEQIKSSVNIKTWVDVRFSNTGSQVIFAE